MTIMPKCSESYKTVCPQTPFSKLARLALDVQRIVEANRSARILVFTQFYETANQIVAELKARGGSDRMQVMRLGKKGTVEQRHRTIRQFQDDARRCAVVCVAEHDVAAVGVTLTAAQHVLIYEPSLDPALAKQAAARAHRLGQRQDVHVTRYAYKASVEEAISVSYTHLRAHETR